METATDYVTMLGATDYGTSADAFVALANLKQTVRQVAAASRAHNCGAASEALGSAWQQFAAYAPLAARTGQTPYASSLLRTIAAWETNTMRTCAVTANPNGMLGGFGMFEQIDPSKKKLMIGAGILAALAIGFVALRK
jgi:hypothetical protein